MSKRKIIKRVSRTLQADYGSVPTLYFCDADGDHVLIKRYSDIRFAIKSHSKQVLAAARNESESTSTSTSTRLSQSLLRLHARMGDDELLVMSTLALAPSPRKSKSKGRPALPDPKAATMEGDVLLHDDKFHWQKGI